MSTKRIIFCNVAWNWAGMAATMLVGFWVTPFLLYHTKEEQYGTWTVVASFAGYFSILDLGVRSSVGRNIAYCRAQGDRQGINAILSTGLISLCIAGVIVFTAIALMSLVFFRFFDIPAALVPSARTALIVVGLTLALYLPLNVFDATLWASQRFGLLNAIDIPAVFFRAGLTFFLIGRGYGLVALAWINLASLVGAQATKAVLSFYVDRDLRMTFSSISRSALRKIYGFGLWNFLLSMTRLATTQLGQVLVAARLGVTLAIPFRLAMLLLGYSSSLLAAGTSVLTPVATTLHAADSQDRQRRLFLRGCRFCTDFALLALGGFMLLGPGLIQLWMGGAYDLPSQQLTWKLLAILAVGEFLPMTQAVSNSVVLGMDRHRLPACLCLLEVITGFAIAAIIAKSYGLVGICVVFAICATLSRGVGPLLYTSRLLGISLGQLLWQVLLPALGTALPPILGLAVLVAWREPRDLPLFITYAGFFGLCLAGLSWGSQWVVAGQRLPTAVGTD